jgi:glycosyltransferase involved in cell wall biosynthesis
LADAMMFSLILATYGRIDELELFLGSLLDQTVGAGAFEVIVVDQNDVLDLQPLIARFVSHFSVTHVRSAIKGLSLNRNIGLAYAKGEFVAFPDDDCQYYPDTLSRVQALFSVGAADVCLGRIRDRQRQKNIIRHWPTRELRVNAWNFFRLTSSITIFARKNDVRFDERMGVGAYFGGSEDADYLWQLLEGGHLLRYFPQVEVNHPDQRSSDVPQYKLNSYMRGFGALIRKHLSLPAVLLFALAMAYYIVQCLVALIRLDVIAFKRRMIANLHCVRGLVMYAP